MAYDYSDYWNNQYERRKKYYHNIYSSVISFYNIPSKEMILDVGGGNGQLANFFGAKKVFLVDISNSGLIFAKKHFKYKTKKLNFLGEWNIKKKFSCALCMEVLEHFKDPDKILKKISNILKSGGVLYISVPNMKPDRQHHFNRIHLRKLKKILVKNNFIIKDFIVVSRFQKMKINSIKSFLYCVGFYFLGKFNLERKFPSILGKFYHIKAIKK